MDRTDSDDLLEGANAQMANPEIRFCPMNPDYSGMRLSTHAFAELEDIAGRRQNYDLDLMLPEQETSAPLPVVIFIHGCGFIPPCDRRQVYISLISRPLTQAGFAVISPDYPLFADEEERDRYGIMRGPVPAASAIHAVRAWLKENAEALRLDPERVSIMGGSAGGMTAFYAIAGYDDPYRAFINLWGVPDPLPDVSRFPPTLSVHGTADPLVPFSNEARLTEALDAHGIEHHLIALEGDGHTPLHRREEFVPAILELLKRVNG